MWFNSSTYIVRFFQHKIIKTGPQKLNYTKHIQIASKQAILQQMLSIFLSHFLLSACMLPPVRWHGIRQYPTKILLYLSELPFAQWILLLASFQLLVRQTEKIHPNIAEKKMKTNTKRFCKSAAAYQCAPHILKFAMLLLFPLSHQKFKKESLLGKWGKVARRQRVKRKY